MKTEIETRLREYERHLQNRDSLALGDMYMEDAEIIPSITGRAKITEALGAMIRDSITGRFNTTQIWGNHELIVEEGKGNWLKPGGEIAGRGKYLLVWKKDNGKWKILRDTWFPEK
ncbi:MAG: YybH family protein [Chitinophagaceae bacterium]